MTIESLIRRLPWDQGRQKSGYHKIRLIQSKTLMMDTYLLYYPEGSEISPHVDKVEWGRHFRLNIMLKRAAKGGDFLCKDPLFRWWRLFWFRSDISEHAVSKIEKGYRIMLSIGWVRK